MFELVADIMSERPVSSRAEHSDVQSEQTCGLDERNEVDLSEALDQACRAGSSQSSEEYPGTSVQFVAAGHEHTTTPKTSPLPPHASRSTTSFKSGSSSSTWYNSSSFRKVFNSFSLHRGC